MEGISTTPNISTQVKLTNDSEKKEKKHKTYLVSDSYIKDIAIFTGGTGALGAGLSLIGQKRIFKDPEYLKNLINYYEKVIDELKKNNLDITDTIKEVEHYKNKKINWNFVKGASKILGGFGLCLFGFIDSAIFIKNLVRDSVKKSEKEEQG